ncbi:MAG TPA: hypothetical protein PKI16_01795 [Candidatus Dojkabacteria bacterium]|nr:hypothetical protein [Candidatus Dojkabacteria bacterium]
MNNHSKLIQKMRNKYSLLQLLFLLIAFFILSPSIVKATELDKYKDSNTESPYYAPILFQAHGQKLNEATQEIQFTVTSVSVNNEIIDITENKDVYVTKDDAVRIVGKTEPKTKLTVYYADKKITVTARENGDWIVLFSITNMSESKYPVSVQLDNAKKTTSLITLVVGSGRKIIQPVLDTSISQGSSFFQDKGEYLAFIFVALLATILGWFLGSYSEKKKRNKNNRMK